MGGPPVNQVSRRRVHVCQQYPRKETDQRRIRGWLPETRRLCRLLRDKLVSCLLLLRLRCWPLLQSYPAVPSVVD